MKKFFIMLIACISMATTVSAQYSRSSSSSDDDDEMSRFHMGIRGGVTVSSYTDKGESLTFPYGGVAMDFKIAPIPLYLETGFYYMNKGITSYSNYHYGYNEYEDQIDGHSIVMPLVASYHISVMPRNKMSVQPFFGAFVSYDVDAEEEDYGFRVGCGWNFGRLYANIGYDLGLMSFNWGHSGTFFATIGFNWAGAK